MKIRFKKSPSGKGKKDIYIYIYIFFFNKGGALKFLSQKNKDASQLTWPLQKLKTKFKIPLPNHHLGGKMKCQAGGKRPFSSDGTAF